MKWSFQNPFVERLTLENLYNTFVGLSPRDQILAMVGGGVLGFLLLVLPLSITSSHLSGIEESIVKSHQQIDDIVGLIGDYQRIKSQYQSMDEALKRGGGSISSSVEGVVESAGLRERVSTIKERPVRPTDLYDEMVVDVSMTKLTLDQIVSLLHQIEQSRTQVLRVVRIQLRVNFESRSLLDATFTVSSYRLTGEV